ncbi:hypothetical protein EVA_17177 [gut metagenome]|uniref:Uncharacterized protein n=1 Tax=gut metagenome TaxID=749906 RepID=J9C4I2_9ZZZZ
MLSPSLTRIMFSSKFMSKNWASIVLIFALQMILTSG